MFNDFIFLCILMFSMIILFYRQIICIVPIWSLSEVFVPVPRLELLFFADADEKTEQPTHKKLQDSRKKGQVVKSHDLNAAIILLISVILMSIFGEYFFEKIYKFLYMCFTDYGNYPVSKDNIKTVISFYMLQFLSITGILFAVVMVMGIIANLLQSGFVFSKEPLKPNLKKLNPFEGFKNLFSKRTVFNLFKTLMKLIFIGIVAFTFIKDNVDRVFSVGGLDVNGLFPFLNDLIFNLVMRVLIVMLVLGIIDFIFQRYDYRKRLRMTKHEVKEEWKQAEGDPQIRSMRKQRQRQLSMNRMMTEVSKATVIVTNPTHLAVALRYNDKIDEIPILVGKGADFVAGKIREVAREFEIPIIENKPLAQVLYKQVEIGEEVPPSLYQAVAEILAVVMKIKKKVVS